MEGDGSFPYSQVDWTLVKKKGVGIAQSLNKLLQSLFIGWVRSTGDRASRFARHGVLLGVEISRRK